MLKVINTTGGALTSAQVIPMTVKYATNRNTSFNGSQIFINKPGYYSIDGSFVITATAIGPISVQLYANGVAIPEAIATETYTAIGDTHTLTINDVEKVISTYNQSNVALTFVVSTAGTLVSANASVVEIK